MLMLGPELEQYHTLCLYKHLQEVQSLEKFNVAGMWSFDNVLVLVLLPIEKL